jgi:hypothetical protein
LQSFLIFLVETIGLSTSPYKVKRDEVVRYQIILPIVSYAVFSVLPAGKKLFVITTLSFSLVFMVGKIIYRWIQKIVNPPKEKKAPRFHEFMKPRVEEEPPGTRIV